MRMLPKVGDSARLLNTVVPDFASAPVSRNRDGHSRLGGGAWFSGNGLAVFAGLLIGGMLLGGAGWLRSCHIAAQRAAAMASEFVAESKSSVSSSAFDTAAPEPMVVQLAPEDIRVTAISLGDPRLAVINGQQVAEGDFVKVRASSVRTEVKLQVVKIADGRIDLSYGSQIITARLAPAAPKSTTP